MTCPLQRFMQWTIEDLSISRKMQFVVFIPVASALLFGGIIFLLKEQAERELLEEMHAKKIVYAFGTVQKSLMNGVVAAVNHSMSKSDLFQQSYQSNKRSCRDAMEELLMLTRDDPAEFAAAKRMENTILQTLKKTDDACRTFLLGGRRISPMEAIQAKIDVESSAREAFASYAALRELLTKKEKRSDKNDQYRKLLNYALIGGMCSNVLIGFVLARFVSRGIAARMHAIGTSTRLVRAGEDLPEPLSGKDDVALLDSFIHEMVEDLNATHRREQAVFDRAADAIISLDRGDKITQANPAAGALWGYAVDELPCMDLCALIMADHRPRLAEALQMARTNGEIVRVELTGATSTGEPLSLHWSISRDYEGERLFCIAHDVTERKRLEQMRRDFVAMISHDLRSPLTSIRCILHLLEEGVYGELSNPGSDAVRKSDREAERLIRLINTMLDYEKMESGQFQLSCSSVDMEGLIQQSISSVERLAQKQGIALVYEGCNFSVTADGDKIVQVVVNLLTNAIKFSPKGERVEIGVVQKDKCVEVSIRDYGRGIEEAQQAAIFEKCRQVKGDGMNQQGTGLGLAIARLIIESHGGVIGVESTPGCGSRFWFTLALPHSGANESEPPVEICMS